MFLRGFFINIQWFSLNTNFGYAHGGLTRKLLKLHYGMGGWRSEQSDLKPLKSVDGPASLLSAFLQ